MDDKQRQDLSACKPDCERTRSGRPAQAEALQALNLLDSVAAAVGGRQQIDTSRAAHFQYQQAVAVIRKTLTEEGPLEDA